MQKATDTLWSAGQNTGSQTTFYRWCENIAARYPLGGYLRGILQEGLSVSSAPGNVTAKPRVQSDSA